MPFAPLFTDAARAWRPLTASLVLSHGFACSGSPALQSRSPALEASPPSAVEQRARDEHGHRLPVPNAQEPVTDPSLAPAVPLPPAQPGDIGRAVPTVLVSASPTGHWTVLCQALDDTDGDGELEVRVSQHGELAGDTLLQFLLTSNAETAIDEFAGSDPSGRWLAYVQNDKLWLLDTTNGRKSELEQADVRASQAPFTPLRGVSFSDTGEHLAYVRQDGDQSDVVLRKLSDGTETVVRISEGLLYRVHFAAGSHFLQVEVVVEDTNKNRRLQWPYPERSGSAPCPSPVPHFSVWQYPGDQPQTRLVEVDSGRVMNSGDLVLAVGSTYVSRTEDRRLVASQAGKPPWLVSSAECAARVTHVDAATGNVLFGCAPAWGQRRDMFLRTPTARKQLGFDLAAFEQDMHRDIDQPRVPLYPRNESLIFNVRTQERWNLLEGTRVLALHGATALLERQDQISIVTLNADATLTQAEPTLRRPPLARVLTQGQWVAVGALLFDLETKTHAGSFPPIGSVHRAPEALSISGMGLFASRAASTQRVSYGPYRWQGAS